MASYKDIAKSTSIVASIQIVQMVFGLIRNKAIALLIGTAGFGVWSIFTTFFEMIGSFSMIGLDQSAVREIASKSDDTREISIIIESLKSVMAITTAITVLVSIIFSKQISCYLFDTEKYQMGIVIVSLMLIFKVISRVFYVILNGLRLLKHLAYSQILSTVLGSGVTIAVIYVWRISAVAVAIGVVSIFMTIIPWFYVRKLNLQRKRITINQAFIRSKGMLSLGLGFTIAGIVSTITTFMGKSYLSNNFNMADVGLYQASWTVSNLYIGMILSAMGVDFMPRLSKVANDNRAVNDLINSQILFGIVAGSIGVLGILLFSVPLLYLIYSSEFLRASEIVRWHVLGVFLRIIAFPFSYAIMAKGKPVAYATIQIIFWVVEYLLLVFMGNLLGFDGLGVNYVLSYILYLSMSCGVTVYATKFRPTSQILKILSIIIFAIAIAFLWSSWGITDNKIYYSVSVCMIVIWGIFVHFLLKRTMQINLFSILKLRRKKHDIH